jgi:hypothetical protein
MIFWILSVSGHSRSPLYGASGGATVTTSDLSGRASQSQATGGLLVYLQLCFGSGPGTNLLPPETFILSRFQLFSQAICQRRSIKRQNALVYTKRPL